MFGLSIPPKGFSLFVGNCKPRVRRVALRSNADGPQMRKEHASQLSSVLFVW